MTSTVQLKDICKIAPSKSEIKNHNLEGSAIVSFLPMEDLGIGAMHITPSKSRRLEEVSGSYTYFKEGDVLLAKVTPCFENGKLGIATDLVNGVGYGSSEFIVIRPDTKRVVPAYLYYRLQEDGFRREGRSLMVGACGLKRLPKSYVAETSIYLPPIAEQERIVNLLDNEFERISKLREDADRNLKNAIALFQAAIKRELEPKEGWKTYSLLEASLASGQYGMSVPSKAYDGIRYLRITDITDNGGLNDDVVSANTEVIDSKYILQDGDILFARTGATVGKTLVYDPIMGKCSYAGYLIMYRPNPSIVLPRLLHYITHSSQYYAWVLSSQTQAVLQNISAKLYNTFSFTIPSVEEQKRIVATLDELDAKCKVLQDNYTKTIALCDDLKQSLLRKAFNGEL